MRESAEIFRLMVVAGEESGDAHAASLVRSLRERAPGASFEFFGSTGARRPDAVVLVDWPDFNLALARALHRRGLRVVYYISPQLWAWRSHRVRQVRRDVDLLLTILPFEREWYAARGVTHVEFVGHPFAGTVAPRVAREEFRARHRLD